ncbi:MAG: KxYKxGKxW signal peptide domain-containing protein [Streptococcus sp.]
MQFKRSKGNFRETDRVVRFKLIKSGKNWLRASTAALGLFRVVRGQVRGDGHCRSSRRWRSSS